MDVNMEKYECLISLSTLNNAPYTRSFKFFSIELKHFLTLSLGGAIVPFDRPQPPVTSLLHTQRHS